jgi:hypothetical protein
MVPPPHHSLVRAGISSSLPDSAQRHAPLLPTVHQEAALLVTDRRGPHSAIGRHRLSMTPPPHRRPIFIEGPRRQGLAWRVQRMVVILRL